MFKKSHSENLIRNSSNLENEVGETVSVRHEPGHVAEWLRRQFQVLVLKCAWVRVPPCPILFAAYSFVFWFDLFSSHTYTMFRQCIFKKPNSKNYSFENLVRLRKHTYKRWFLAHTKHSCPSG